MGKSERKSERPAALEPLRATQAAAIEAEGRRLGYPEEHIANAIAEAVSPIEPSNYPTAAALGSEMEKLRELAHDPDTLSDRVLEDIFARVRSPRTQLPKKMNKKKLRDAIRDVVLRYAIEKEVISNLRQARQRNNRLERIAKTAAAFLEAASDEEVWREITRVFEPNENSRDPRETMHHVIDIARLALEPISGNDINLRSTDQSGRAISPLSWLIGKYLPDIYAQFFRAPVGRSSTRKDGMTGDADGPCIRFVMAISEAFRIQVAPDTVARSITMIRSCGPAPAS